MGDDRWRSKRHHSQQASYEGFLGENGVYLVFFFFADSRWVWGSHFRHGVWDDFRDRRYFSLLN